MMMMMMIDMRWKIHPDEITPCYGWRTRDDVICVRVSSSWRCNEGTVSITQNAREQKKKKRSKGYVQKKKKKAKKQKKQKSHHESQILSRT